MKKLLSLLLAFCLILGCSAAVFADDQWAEENGLNKTESVEELYAAALAEGGVSGFLPDPWMQCCSFR